MKKLFILIGFCLMSLGLFAQLNYNAKSIYFTNADSATVRLNASNCNNCGFIYYNRITEKFRVFQDSTWYDLIDTAGGEGGNTYTFENGLHLDSLTAKLGGILTNSTYTLVGDSTQFGLLFDKTGTFYATKAAYLFSGDFWSGDNNAIVGANIQGSNISFENISRGANGSASNIGITGNGTTATQTQTTLQGTRVVSVVALANGATIPSYTITGSTGFKGLEYSADYSSNYSIRSTPDKNYSDTHLAGSTFTDAPANGDVPTHNGTNWTFSPPTGTPAGANTQIQFNNAGVFGASADLTWDGAVINIGGTTVSQSQLTSETAFALVPNNSAAIDGYDMFIGGGAVGSGVGNGGDLRLSVGAGLGGGVVGGVTIDLINDEILIARTSSGNITITPSNTDTSIGETINLNAGVATTGGAVGGNVIINGGDGSTTDGNVTLGSIHTEDIIIGTTSGETMRIQNDSDVGINTAAPTHSLSVAGNIANDNIFVAQEDTGLKIIEAIETAGARQLGFYGVTPIGQAAAIADLGTVLSAVGLRASGTAWSLTTTGAIDFGGATAIKGTTTNDNATALDIGEYIESLIAVGSAAALTTNTTLNVTSISLTAGDWDVSGNVNFTDGTATVAARSGGITTTSATIPTDGSEVYLGANVVGSTELNSVTPSIKRVSIAGTTTVYLVARATFTVGTVSAFGKISARRVR